MRIVQYYPNARSFVPARSQWTGLANEIDRLFAGTALSRADFPVELSEDNDNTYVRAELPGVRREDIKVETADGSLTITASRREKNDGKEEAYTASRSVSLPGDVQLDKVAAAYENGVLTVTLPKREALKPREIPVS